MQLSISKYNRYVIFSMQHQVIVCKDPKLIREGDNEKQFHFLDDPGIYAFNVQKKLSVPKGRPSLVTLRERRRYAQIEEEKEKGVYQYMKYRRQKLILKKYSRELKKWQQEHEDRMEHPENYPDPEPIIPFDPTNYLDLSFAPKTTNEIMKVKEVRRKLKHQVLDILSNGVIEALREVKQLCGAYRREYISNSVLMMIEENVAVMVKNVDPE